MIKCINLTNACMFIRSPIIRGLILLYCTSLLVCEVNGRNADSFLYVSGADPENISRGGPTLSKIDSVLRITVEVHKYETKPHFFSFPVISAIKSFANSRRVRTPPPPPPPLFPPGGWCFFVSPVLRRGFFFF